MMAAAPTAVFSLGLATPWIISQVATRVASLTAKVGDSLTALLRSTKNLANLLDQLKALLKQADDLFERVLKGGSATGMRPQHTSSSRPALDPSDMADLKYYTGPGYDDINQALRGQIPLTPDIQTKVDGAVCALDGLPDYSGTGVSRGNAASW